MHVFHIRHRPSQITCGQFHTEAVKRFQQNALCLHQSLPHSAVGRLPEIAALGMLRVGPAGQDADLHIRDGTARQHTTVYLFFQMCQHQPLPVFIQYVFTAQAAETQPAAALIRL